MGIDFLPLMLRLCWVISCAVLACLLLRAPLRRLVGAELAYAFWALVPLAVLAALMPAMTVRHVPIDLRIARLATEAAPALKGATAAAPVPWMLAWAAGALALLAWFWIGHARFRRGLGPLAPSAQGLVSPRTDAGPALVGLWRPQVVLPADFGTRYTAPEQALILAHEQVHAQRGDAWANLLQAGLQCAFWFHPLIHAAASRFRFDQELACDAAVMRRHGAPRQRYAEAILKTQGGTAPPLTTPCHWQSLHPLKERIMTLRLSPPSAARRLFGRLLLLSCASAASYGAVHAEVAPATAYLVALEFEAGGSTSIPRIHTHAGEPFSISSITKDSAGKDVTWTSEFRLVRSGQNSVTVKSTLKRDGTILSEPTVMTRLGETARIRIGADGDSTAMKLAMTVTELPEKK